MNLPAYESLIYSRAMEIIATDTERLHAYDRTTRSIAIANNDRLPELRDQLNALLSDAINDAISENEADDHGQSDIYPEDEV